MKIKTEKKCVDFSMLGVLLALFITPNLNISAHIALGVALIGLLGLHLFLNKAWISNTIKKIKEGRFEMNSLMWTALVLAVIFIIVNITGFLAIPEAKIAGHPSGIAIAHSLSSRLCLIPLFIHVKKHWKYLTGSQKKKSVRPSNPLEANKTLRPTKD